MSDGPNDQASPRVYLQQASIPPVSAAQLGLAYHGAVSGLPYSVLLTQAGDAIVTLSSGTVITVRRKIAVVENSATINVSVDGLTVDDVEEVELLQAHLLQALVFHARIIYARACAAA
jgi:hypothetical protein